MKTRKGTADLEHVTQAKVGQTVPDVFLRSQLSLMPELKNGFAFVGLKFVSCLRSSGLHLVGQCQAQPVLRTFQQTKEKADLNQIQVGIKVEAAGSGFRFLKTGFRLGFCRVKWLFENFKIDQPGTKSDTN